MSIYVVSVSLLLKSYESFLTSSSQSHYIGQISFKNVFTLLNENWLRTFLPYYFFHAYFTIINNRTSFKNLVLSCKIFKAYLVIFQDYVQKS